MNWLQKISMGIWEDIDDYGPKHNNAWLSYQDRLDFVNEYGWSIPEKQAIKEIKQFVGQDKIIEIGSGLGLWAKLLSDEGIQITPTDLPVESQHSHFKSKRNPYVNIERHNHLDALKIYNSLNGYNVLMMVWPPYDSPMAAEALKVFNGNKIIYIGEENGGCTGNDCFFDILEREWTVIDRINIPRWAGIYDSLWLGVKK